MVLLSEVESVAAWAE